MTGKKSSIDGADAKTRKAHPLTTGVLDYFPDALLAVAECSRLGNEQHNPGQPLHWAKEKSTDHADCITRHLLDRGGFDTDDVRHSAKVAWRALALLQTELEDEAAAQMNAPEPERLVPPRMFISISGVSVGVDHRTELANRRDATDIRGTKNNEGRRGRDGIGGKVFKGVLTSRFGRRSTDPLPT